MGESADDKTPDSAGKTPEVDWSTEMKIADYAIELLGFIQDNFGSQRFLLTELENFNPRRRVYNNSTLLQNLKQQRLVTSEVGQNGKIYFKIKL
jgi:hypothetical protein